MKFLTLSFILVTLFPITGWEFHQIYSENWNLHIQAKDISHRADIKKTISDMNKDYITISKIDEEVYLSSIVEELKLEYDTPLNVPQDYAAYCELTHQVTSVLSIQNLSKNFIATIFVSPIGGSDKSRIYKIPSNTTTPIRILHNWNGAVLKVANISAEATILKVSLF